MRNHAKRLLASTDPWVQGWSGHHHPNLSKGASYASPHSSTFELLAVAVLCRQGLEIHVITHAYLLQNQAAVWVYTCMMLQAGTARRFPRANYLEVLNLWAYGEKESVHTNSGPSRSIKCRRVTIAIGSSEWLIEWNGTGAMTAQRWGPKTNRKEFAEQQQEVCNENTCHAQTQELGVTSDSETPDHPSL